MNRGGYNIPPLLFQQSDRDKRRAAVKRKEKHNVSCL